MKLRVAAVQADLSWEDISANLSRFDRLLETAEQADLYILPEMFTTGFTMNAASCAEAADRSEAINWLLSKAKQKNAAITGSLVIADKGNYYNRSIFAKPDGTFHTYDKRHLFRLANEHDIYIAGKEKIVVEWKGFSILLQICYDLRFPVWSRNEKTANGELLYDAIVYVANWPTPRINAWSSLLPARAIENLAYVAGVNRVGKDGKDMSYNGGTVLIDPRGVTQSQAADNKEEIIYSTWEKEELQSYRDKFPFWMDMDSVTVNL